MAEKITTEEKKNRIIEYLRRARDIDKMTRGHQPNQGARTPFAIFSRGLKNCLTDDVTPSDLSSTEKLCIQLVKKGVLERVMPECSYKYYRIEDGI